jgi:hypothetical protein
MRDGIPIGGKRSPEIGELENFLSGDISPIFR